MADRGPQLGLIRMEAFSRAAPVAPDPEAPVPALVLARYLFFLTQRPISHSNVHFLRRRIRGLQSLGPLLDGPADDLAVARRVIASLDAANLHRLSERLQILLFPFARAEVPPGYINADAAPPPEFVATAERVLLVLAPAIGIGDEIVTFPLPRRLKRANEHAHVTTLSAYDGLWDAVDGVDRALTYETHAELVAALRGEVSAARADLVILVDFEQADLFRAVARERRIDRYAEISLGARVLAAVDNRARWTFHQSLPPAYLTNVYDGFDELTRRLGLETADDDRAAEPTPREATEPLHVFVSPFSSKYDPSPRYWSALIAALAQENRAREAEFVVDPGPNARTRAFANELARAAAARAAGARASFRAAEPAPLPLRKVVDELERADVVICADSFAAHAAPLHGCTTLVVATRGLENWRAPGDRSFYFDAAAPLMEVVAGMSEVLALAPVPRPAVGAHEERLAEADDALAKAFANGSTIVELCMIWDRFATAREEVVARITEWPPSAATLVHDHPYDVPARRLNGDGAPAPSLEDNLRRFIETQRLEWRKTNLSRYLQVRLSEERR